jgi:chaperonin cofactor prefoldin
LIKNKSPETKEKYASRREAQLKALEKEVENDERQLNVRLENVNNMANILMEKFMKMQNAISKHDEGKNLAELP